MTDLVFIEPARLDATPFTTSVVIAEFAGVKHHAIQQLLTKHQNDFEEFGLLAFEMRAVDRARGTKYEKQYRLTEEQATLLMTYLKNTEQVRAFKKELVRQFYVMRKELTKRQIGKAQQLPVHHDLTDAIQDSIPEGPHKRWAYRQFTDLAYLNSVGMTAKKLREARGAAKDAKAIDFMTSDELDAVGQVKAQIAVLVKMGLGYQEVKALLARQQERMRGTELQL